MAGPVRIRCEHVGVRYRGRTVLQDIHLEIRQGEILGVVGPGGAGKSVLMKLLPALIAPSAGRVLVDGVDLAGLSRVGLAEVRDGFGYLFQNYALFDFMTVLDNVAFPLRQGKRVPEAEAVERARERLDAVGLLRAVGQFPRELSGGMKKRVALARATVADPSIAVYDDPSAGLDPVTSSRIFELIRVMHARVPGCASVVVSHDVDRMRPLCDRFIAIIGGRIAFDGGEAELPGAPPMVRAIFDGGLVAEGGA